MAKKKVTPRIFTGPSDKLDKVDHNRLQEEINAFGEFLHTYLHGKAMNSLSVNFSGEFFKGVRATVSFEQDVELLEEAKKYAR